MEVISNVQVYGIDNAIRSSKLPMSTDVESLGSTMTHTVKQLGSSPPGSGHDNFLNGIIAQFDLTFTIKAWTEAERYHFFDFISSQSTMHRITKFDIDNQYIEYVDGRIIKIIKEKIDEYNNLCKRVIPSSLDATVEHQNEANKKYLEILYSNPCGFKLTAAMTTNYRQLKTIVSQRKNHKLPEWREFCNQVVEFPMFKELCFGN